MRSEATTVKAYLDELPADRAAALSKVRTVVRRHLPAGIVETMRWGMISYEVPLSVVPDTYNGQPLSYAGLASQKNAMSLYLMSVYADEALSTWFADAYRASGKRLDMGKSCVRFRTLDDLPLDLVGQAIGKVTLEEFVARYQQVHRNR